MSISHQYRLGHLADGLWQRHSHPATFERSNRIIAGVPDGDPTIFARMVECLEPPYYLLYVLHTPRGEAEPGRYQSPAPSFAQVEAFLSRFSGFLSADARYDLWAHSPTDAGTVVWDRHNLLFAYGPLDRFTSALHTLGFSPGQPKVPAPHEHQYRAELDPLARDLMAAFDWSLSPLRPEDEQ